MGNAVPLLVFFHILDSKISAQIDDFGLGENPFIYQRRAQTLGRGCEDHIHLTGQLLHIVIHTFLIDQLKKVLVNPCIFLIHITPGSQPFDLHFSVSQKESDQF